MQLEFQLLLESGRFKKRDQRALASQGDGTAFLGYQQTQRIAALGQADSGAMPGAVLGRQPDGGGHGQKAGRPFEVISPDDDGSVVGGRRRLKQRADKLAADEGLQLD